MSGFKEGPVCMQYHCDSRVLYLSKYPSLHGLEAIPGDPASSQLRLQAGQMPMYIQAVTASSHGFPRRCQLLAAKIAIKNGLQAPRPHRGIIQCFDEIYSHWRGRGGLKIKESTSQDSDYK